jgi:hypothetical protein
MLEKLIELGFEAESLGVDRRGVELFKILTSQGWTYERFADVEAVETWAHYHKPEENDGNSG